MELLCTDRYVLVSSIAFHPSRPVSGRSLLIMCMPWNWQTTVGTYVMQLWICTCDHPLQYSVCACAHTQTHTHTHTHTHTM